MINPLDYLYYKVYKGLSYISGGGNPMSQIGATMVLLMINFSTIYYLIAGELPESVLTGAMIIIILFCTIYFSIKEDKILAKYDQESEQSYRKGNMIVTVYVILTFVAAICVLRPR